MTRTIGREGMLSVALITVFIAIALLRIVIDPQIFESSIREGDISLKDVYAPCDFSYPWEINEERTVDARKAAAASVPYYIRRDTDKEADVRFAVETFFGVVADEKNKDISLSDKIAALKERTDGVLSDKDYKMFLEYPDIEGLKNDTILIVKNVLYKGYLDDAGAEILAKENPEMVIISDDGTGPATERRADELFTSVSVKPGIEKYSCERIDEKKGIVMAVGAVVNAYVKPTLFPEADRTNVERLRVSDKVQPVYNIYKVKKNELIVEKGSRISARHVAELSELRSFLKEGEFRLFFLGSLLLFLLLGLVGTIYLRFSRRENFLKKTKDIGMMLLGMLFMIIVSDSIIEANQPIYLIPMATISMMMVILVGFDVAFLSALLVSMYVSIMTGGDVGVTIVFLVESVVGMCAVNGVRRRVNILWAGLIAGLAKSVAIICLGLLNGIEINTYFSEGIWGIASGLLSGIIVTGFLPLFESIFKVPTNISLLEMSDLNHPLLKKLSLEAPGTYHHSIMVGNLAEAACDSINANSLLARVGAYYHDVGKLSKPQYFAENEMGERSRHEGLTPSMSALIIHSHVKEGIEMAKKYKLSGMIVDFIKQHHGNGLISYFYTKALNDTKEGVILDEKDFRYPGPKPQTRETAVVLLADALEAASRAVDDPIPSSIRNMVKKIVNSKFIDGQLDECDLTLKDMSKISDSFVRVLMASFHTRTTYPGNEDLVYGGKNNGENKLRRQKSAKQS